MFNGDKLARVEGVITQHVFLKMNLNSVPKSGNSAGHWFVFFSFFFFSLSEK